MKVTRLLENNRGMKSWVTSVQKDWFLCKQVSQAWQWALLHFRYTFTVIQLFTYCTSRIFNWIKFCPTPLPLFYRHSVPGICNESILTKEHSYRGIYVLAWPYLEGSDNKAWPQFEVTIIYYRMPLRVCDAISCLTGYWASKEWWSVFWLTCFNSPAVSVFEQNDDITIACYIHACMPAMKVIEWSMH